MGKAEWTSALRGHVMCSEEGIQGDSNSREIHACMYLRHECVFPMFKAHHEGEDVGVLDLKQVAGALFWTQGTVELRTFCKGSIIPTTAQSTVDHTSHAPNANPWVAFFAFSPIVSPACTISGTLAREGYGNLDLALTP